MIRRAIIAAALLGGLAGAAEAQEEIRLTPDAGVYTLAATWGTEPDLAQVCFFREDTAEVLGCVTSPELHGSGVQAAILRAVLIPNPGQDVSIRAYAEDTSGNRSGDSPNRAIADFTPPAAPVILEGGS